MPLTGALSRNRTSPDGNADVSRKIKMDERNSLLTMSCFAVIGGPGGQARQQNYREMLV